MDTEIDNQIEITKARVELLKLQQQIAEDAGPIVFTIALDRFGHVIPVMGPLAKGREVEDWDQLINVLEQVLRNARDTREAARSEREKALMDAKVEAMVAERLRGVGPSSNGHSEPT
jgi:hypothetical protein